MVKIKKTAKSGGKFRSRAHRPPAGSTSKAFARTSNVDHSLDVDLGDELFTLRDVARHTSFNHSERQDSKSQLRDKAINFVKSADWLKGTLHEGEKKLNPEESYTLESQSNHIEPIPDATIVDHPIQRVASPTPSDSSDEVVHFSGRNKPVRTSADKHTLPKEAPFSARSGPPSEATSSRIAPTFNSDFTPDPLPNQESSIATIPDGQGNGRAETSLLQAPSSQSKDPSAQNNHLRSSSNRRGQGDLDDSLADYMQNMWTHGELDDDFVSQARSLKRNSNGWDASDLADFDNLSTSDEIGQAVDLVLARRERQSGLQYLIVWQGQSVDEARWIHHQSLTMEGAKDLIRQFDEEERYTMAITDSSDDGSTDGMEDEQGLGEDSNENIDSSEDHDDDESLMEERMMMRMADEQIARLLSKQEELGMGSDELLLFDDPGDDGKCADRKEKLKTVSDSRRSKREKTKEGWLGKNQEHYFGSHDGWSADDYGSFDIMDFDRPSISKKSKAKKEPLFDLSDSELEAELREQYAADRKKKKAKKQEREELRAQGLLGKKNKFKPDLGVRYNDGLSIQQLKHEIEEFLFHDNTTLTLPPMGKSERKTVHQIASHFNLKSKSIGSGKSRFPTLHKTPHTIDFDATLFNRVERKFRGRVLSRVDRRTRGGRVTRSGGNGITSGTGYAEGETVGASAPELGSDNRGRAMLEKMGWSTGMALGALDNKGILQPITHVVKKTRAGLG